MHFRVHAVICSTCRPEYLQSLQHFWQYILLHPKITISGCMPPPVLTRCDTILSVLNLPAWRKYLSVHLDQRFATYITSGVQFGFWVGFQRQHSLKPRRRNLHFAYDNADVVKSYIATETEQDRFLDPILSRSISVHCSPFGVIPSPFGVIPMHI